jgi:hypothetical protein
LCLASNLAELQGYCLEWAKGFDVEDEACRKNRDLWVRCTPFAHIGNGDLLALDADGRIENPPVAYLSHEGEGPSSIIAPSFTEFLRHWEAMSYIGPEIWLLNHWIRSDSGFIDSAQTKTELLRNLLLKR